jgi:hypothetical protein
LGFAAMLGVGVSIKTRGRSAIRSAGFKNQGGDTINRSLHPE